MLKKMRINYYCWALIILFISVSIAMQVPGGAYSMEGIYITAPLIAAYIFWSYRVFNRDDRTQATIFCDNFFKISVSFLLGILLSLIFQSNNVDVRGWWPLIIGLVCLTGLLFALLFSSALVLVSHNNHYTTGFSFVIILMISLVYFLQRIESIDLFYPLLGLLLLFHFLIVFIRYLLEYKK